MRRLGPVAMSGAERSRLWRARVKLRNVSELVARDIRQLPLWIDPQEAMPLVEAWHMRGLRYPITAAQWSTLGPLALATPEQRAMAADAIKHGPQAPAPAFAVWGSLMAKLQAVRAMVAQATKPMAQALAAVVKPRTVAYAMPKGQCPPWVHEHDGVWAYRTAGCSP